MAARRYPVGGDCVAAAFPNVDTTGLAAAAQAISASTGSVAGTALTAALDPQHWQQSRSAIDGLRRFGVAALAGAPALAGWVRLCAPRAVSLEQQHTVFEGLLALAELRRLAADPHDAPPQAVAVVTDFLDTAFETSLMTLLVPPLRVWHRGAVGYLRGLHGDPERLMSVLNGFLAALDSSAQPKGDHDSWDEYTRMELVAAIVDLGPRLEQLRIERSWQAMIQDDAEVEADPEPVAAKPAAADPPPADTPAPDVAGHPASAVPGPVAAGSVERGPVTAVPRSLTEWLIGELAAPSMARRRAACDALATLGPQAATALPALLRLLAELDPEPDAVVGELRNQALAAAVAVSSSVPWEQ
ncbi:MAG TPA: hypothetical protein VGJ44_16740 [Kribbellaceae bacterium]|jgi:hypothetical protein